MLSPQVTGRKIKTRRVRGNDAVGTSSQASDQEHPLLGSRRPRTMRHDPRVLPSTGRGARTAPAVLSPLESMPDLLIAELCSLHTS